MNYELTGQKFGRLTVKKKTRKQGTSQMWLCICECGNSIEVRASSLVNGKSDSCGCLRKERLRQKKITHGQTKSRVYDIWRSLKKRCLVRKSSGYNNYGGRGIKICDEWKNSFENFRNWAYSHGYSDDLTIDRIDVNGNYEPNNCRFVDYKTQARNRRNNNCIEYKGNTKTIAEWAEILGVCSSTLRERKNRGWDNEKIIGVPPRIYKRGKDE